jgi:hypothetical protein
MNTRGIDMLYRSEVVRGVKDKGLIFKSHHHHVPRKIARSWSWSSFLVI